MLIGAGCGLGRRLEDDVAEVAAVGGLRHMHVLIDMRDRRTVSPTWALVQLLHFHMQRICAWRYVLHKERAIVANADGVRARSRFIRLICGPLGRRRTRRQSRMRRVKLSIYETRRKAALDPRRQHHPPNHDRARAAERRVVNLARLSLDDLKVIGHANAYVRALEPLADADAERAW